MENSIHTGPRAISIVVTTFGTDTLYTHACLESIRRWKNAHHELIVVVHDESPLLRAYLDACCGDGLIDHMLFAADGHGHTASVNLGAQTASADVFFNICNDIQIGPSIVDDCARKLHSDRQLGMIGWLWGGNPGVFWDEGSITRYRLHRKNDGILPRRHERNIRSAPWFTGRYFEGIGGPKRIRLCNTAFFGIRRGVLDQIGGGFAPTYRHFFADDFLNYAVLDQGYDIRSFDQRFRGKREFFFETQHDHKDVQDRRRREDSLPHDIACLSTAMQLGGGMSRDDLVYLHFLARAIPDGVTVTGVGVWKGASSIILLDALKERRVRFHFIDCFDLPGISAVSAQRPVSREQFTNAIEPFIASGHEVHVTRANSLALERFPRSEFIFVDAGHTKECISHDARLARDCLTEEGVAAFHDFDQPMGPHVKPVLEAMFPKLELRETVAVYRNRQVTRERFEWPAATKQPVGSGPARD